MPNIRKIGQSITKYLTNPWSEFLGDICKVSLKLIRRYYIESIYEVMEYESTLTLHDPKGKEATFCKRQKVRYLQNNTIAFEDQAWGDGEILIDYRCTPGTPVDQYRLDYKTFILISLRELKNRGDIDVFNIRWGLQDGFLRPNELWATEIRRRIKHLKISVIFPKSRPPTHWSILEKNRQRTLSLGKETRQQLPNGCWKVSWDKKKPRLYETYILKWEW